MKSNSGLASSDGSRAHNPPRAVRGKGDISGRVVCARRRSRAALSTFSAQFPLGVIPRLPTRTLSLTVIDRVQTMLRPHGHAHRV